MTDLIVGYLAGYPEFTAFMTVMGILRTINKPLFALISKGVAATDTTFDNKLWNKVRHHKVMKSFLWLLDFTTSIKIKTK